MFDPTLVYPAAAVGIVALAVIVLLTVNFFTVEQRTAAIFQRFGKFAREAGLA